MIQLNISDTICVSDTESKLIQNMFLMAPRCILELFSLETCDFSTIQSVVQQCSMNYL